MIKLLHIENFKCFEDQRFELGNLTLLTGLNGTGKSSVIQALLLLRQSYQDQSLQDKKLLLNGDLIQLGTAQDVLFREAEHDKFGFGLEFCGLSAKWHFKYAMHAEAVQLTSEQVSDEVYNTSLFGDSFHYLQADRIGPQSAFETSDYAVRECKQLGIKGEYTPHFLREFGYAKTLTDKRVHPDATGAELMHQVEAWMGEISPGIRINLGNYDRDMNRINLRYTFPSGKVRSNPFRSTNVGFGITYTLPIVLALLASEKDALVLLENPESCMHPQGQFKLGELMARAASCGIQVIVESHSDHILNGIRVAVRQGHINSNEVSLHYLSRPADTDQLRSKVDSPRLDEDGRIDEWPEGFFDEWEKGLEQLF
jgi:predicted ATPase